MSSKVDERIVNMKFNNSQFEKGVADTSKSLDSLKKSLDLKNVGKGIGDMASSLRNMSVEGLANGVQNIASKFSALSIIGITALANIANKAVDAGLTIMRSLTIDPIKAGFDEYELKMGSIQTILANTARYGTKLPEVTANLDELNEYADKTIYNFGDMTKNIGLFTNAGIKVGDATSMIKGFSNEAAASGTNAQGAASAAYQLSQALSAGTIRLMDWRSLQNVGMGNKNMQKGLIEIADSMGLLNEKTITAEAVSKDFNGSLEKNWLSADVMSSYLKIMAGDMTEAEQAALGLTKSQIKMFKGQQQRGEEAATKVRTWTQLIGTMQEGVGSGWAQTFDILIGDFNQATDLWTGVNDALGPIVEGMSKARNDLLLAWAEGGGRESLINSVANAWKAAVAIIGPIKDAFTDIFPPMTAKNLLNITKGFEQFTKNLMPSKTTLDQIGRAAKGFFAVLDIGWMVIKQVVGLFGRLFGAMAPVGGGLLDMSANLGDWLVGVRDAIKNGEGLTKVFEWLGDQGEKIINVFKKMGKWVGDTFPIDNLALAWTNVGGAMQAAWEFMQPVFSFLRDAFLNVRDAIRGFFESADFNVLVGALNVGALGGIILLIKKGIDKFLDIFKGNGLTGLGDKIKDIFNSVTETFGAMQAKLKSEALKQIAIAIAIITAAVIALSFVDPVKLAVSLGAITVMFGQLAAIMAIMDKTMKDFNAGKMAVLASTMILLAGAMVIFAAAVHIMAALDWNELARGMTGMAAGLGIMTGALAAIGKIKGSIAGSSASLILMGGAIVILASALKIMSTMSWDDIGRSMAVLAGGLAALAVGAKLIQGSIAGAASMILISVAITAISGAMKVFATMSWDDIGRSMVAMAGAVGILVGAVTLLSLLKMAPVGAATMIAMSVAITILTGAMKIFATMSWDEIGRSLTMLGGSLAILAGAMALMGIPLVALGGLALGVVAAGMMLLAPALKILGTMSWDEIGRGLAMLGASLAILAVGGLLLIPASVGFLLLGVAMLAIGGGAMMAGTGMAMFAAGFAALAGAAALGSEAIKNALLTIASTIPDMMKAFAQGLIDFAVVIATGGAEFTKAFTVLLTSLIDATITIMPKIGEAIQKMVDLLIQIMQKNIPQLVRAGLKMLIAILDGIGDNIKKVIDKSAAIVTGLLRGLGDAKNVNKIIKAGGDMVLNWINGIGSYISNNSWRFTSAGSRMFRAIVDGVSRAIENGAGDLAYAGRRIAEALWNGAMSFLGINSPSKKFQYEAMPWVFAGIEKGADQGIHRAENTGSNIGKAMVAGVENSIKKMDSGLVIAPIRPVVEPVIDLDKYKYGVGLIGSHPLPPVVIDVEPSVKLAEHAQYSGDAARASYEAYEYDMWKAGRSGDVYFSQTNNSPKALSNAEIYRRTNNQISEAKKELTTTDA